MLYSTLFAALACFAGNAIAAPTSPAQAAPRLSGGQKTLCYTRLGPNAVQGGPATSWAYSTTACTTTSSITTVITRIPRSVTSTVTVVTTSTTTPSTSIHTLTTTSTASTNTTITNVVTAITILTANTSTTTTTTVPAPPNFTPIQKSLNGSSYSGQYGGSNLTKRWGAGDSGLSSLLPFGLNHTQPQFVSCAVYTSGSCSTATTTITSTTQATAPTTTTTTTSTFIVTTVPIVNTTVTSTTTSTSTITAFSTTTSTSTTTITSTSTTSVYAACATNNFADTYLGGGLTNADMSGAYSVNYAPVTDMYDCCVAALLTPNADNFVYDSSNGCYFATTATCPNPPFSFHIKTRSTIFYAYGNLGCASINTIQS